jgi:hypothetical protein
MGASRRYRRRLLRPASNTRRGPRLLLLPEISETMPPVLRDALAIRNAATVSGRCACGAVRQLDGPGPIQPDTVRWATFLHEADCPAGDEHVRRLWAQWKATA